MCIHFWKKNLDDLAPIHPSLPNRSPMLKQTKICLSENTSRRHDLIVHLPSKGLEKLHEAPSNRKRSFRWRIFSSPPRTPDRSLQASDDITPPAFWGWGQSSRRRSASLSTSQTKHIILPSCCSPQGKNLRVQSNSFRPEWRLQDIKDGDGIRSTYVTAQDSPHSYLLHAIRKEDLWVLRWELDWSD